MDIEIVHDALASTAPNRKNRGLIGDPVVPSENDICRWRDSLMRFLDEIDDGSLSVDDLRFALAEYG